MRKLTGYIGALIIVFALMGSILAGYALNVNGSSSVINEYERVTDVSGLYSHTQEPSYIDYNPASNYINYQTGPTEYNNNAGKATYLKVENSNITIRWSDKHIIVDGVDQGAYDTLSSPSIAFITPKCYLSYENVNVYSLYRVGGGIVNFTSTDINININNGDLTIIADSNTYSLGVIDIALVYNTVNPDYYSSNWQPGEITAYMNNKDEALYLTQNPLGLYHYDKWRAILTNTETTIDLIGDGTYTDYGVNEYTLDTSIGYNLYVYYPISVNSTPNIGITYTESNRVNNYLINTTPGSTVTTSDIIDLMSISAGDLYPAQDVRFRNALLLDDYRAEYPDIIHSRWFAPYLVWSDYVLEGQGGAVHRYSLYDIINTYNIPGGADELIITANSTDIRSYTVAGQTYTFDMDMCAFYINNGNAPTVMYDIASKKDYVIYDIDSGLCKLYAYDGTLKGSGTLNQIGVIFVDSTYTLGKYEISYGEFPYTSENAPVDMSGRPRPFITVQSTVNNPATNQYMDVTKGISIKSDNTANVVWDNEYSNGNIQILFRAEDTNQSYHNGLIVGDNTISIDYADSSYSITLNGGDPVAIGKWRNIVLNMDLRTGELSAIPVRTFNSYTNVVMDTASIVIGDMVNPAPTNTIEWTPTANSLMFNVYSTAVFMNTYGVVMVNPQLNITEYFTDLNGFYRMRLYNFSVLGSSITVNGVTADVTNNSITIDGQTVQVKDMAITYADGHAYISDSNVNIDLGEVVNYNVSMAGAWYFETELLKGYTSQKMVYSWDWGDFILNNTQFCIMYMGIALIGLIVARRYCSLSITDYIVLIASFAIALTVQVIA